MGRIEDAIAMEEAGAAYYREMAGLHPGRALAFAAAHMAEDEENHARILRAYAAGKGFTPEGEGASPGIFAGLDPGEDAREEQLDFYALALEREEESIRHYEAMEAEGSDPAMIRFLISQEQQHKAILQELLTLLTRPRDWVEDAEFGNREEY